MRMQKIWNWLPLSHHPSLPSILIPLRIHICDELGGGITLSLALSLSLSLSLSLYLSISLTHTPTRAHKLAHNISPSHTNLHTLTLHCTHIHTHTQPHPHTRTPTLFLQSPQTVHSLTNIESFFLILSPFLLCK